MTPPRGGLVAVVDDEPGLRETVSFALRREGYQVETFADGRAAWQAFETRLPDVAVLDILMPGLAGYGGAVTAATRPEGGACFTVRLPIQ